MRWAMTRSPPASSMATTSPILFVCTASGLMMENVRSIDMTSLLKQAGLEQAGECLSHLRRRPRHPDAGRLQGGDLVLRGPLAARDDGASVAHAFAGRCGLAGDEARHRLLHVRLGEGGRFLLGGAA